MKQITKKPKIHKNGFPPKEISFHTIATRVAPENVAQLHEWYERHNTYVMVMERPTQSIDLFELSKKYGALDESSVKRIMYQLVTTVLKLRTAGIVHHDIKDENILINMETFQIKLIDFGCAKNYSTDVVSHFITLFGSVFMFEQVFNVFSVQQKRFSGTPEFFPPEWFHSKRYEQDKMTVWQMGCLFYILLTGKPPFRAAKDIQSAEWVAHRPILRHLRRYTYSLLVSMLAPSHDDRVGIEDILKHPYWTT